MTEATWNGKPLSEYTKEALIGIVVKTNRLLDWERRDHRKTRDILATLPDEPSESPVARWIRSWAI